MGNKVKYNLKNVHAAKLGTLWSRPGKSGAIVTIYIHPTRYTIELIDKNDYFTVSFFAKELKKALGYIGSRSGRDGDKIAESGLTPIAVDDSVTYAESDLTFICKKIYKQQIDKD